MIIWRCLREVSSIDQTPRTASSRVFFLNIHNKGNSYNKNLHNVWRWKHQSYCCCCFFGDHIITARQRKVSNSILWISFQKNQQQHNEPQIQTQKKRQRLTKQPKTITKANDDDKPTFFCIEKGPWGLGFVFALLHQQGRETIKKNN